MRFLHWMFSFEGRLGFRGWWRHSFHSFGMVMAIIVAIIAASVAIQQPLLFFAGFIAAVAIGGVAQTSATIRRMHDRGVSGWWLLAGTLATILLFACFFLLPIVREDLRGAALAAIIVGIVATGIAQMIVLHGPTGTTPNRFGPPPVD